MLVDIFCLFLLLFYFFLCYLWYKLGRFLILLIVNDFNWKEFKEEWKWEDEGFEGIIYFCWVIVIPTYYIYILWKKIVNKL